MNKFKGGASRGGGSFRGGAGASRPPFKKRSYGASSDSRGDSRGPRTYAARGNAAGVMHPATCSKCGNKCEVPFEPSGDRPVLCRDCFVPKAEFGAERARPSFSKFGDKKPYTKFGDRAPRREYGSRDAAPSYARPEYRSAPAAAPSADNSKQFAEINAKLDKLINAIERMTEKRD